MSVTTFILMVILIVVGRGRDLSRDVSRVVGVFMAIFTVFWVLLFLGPREKRKEGEMGEKGRGKGWMDGLRVPECTLLYFGCCVLHTCEMDILFTHVFVYEISISM